MKAILIPVLYLLSGVLIAPGTAFVYYVWSIKGAIQTGNLIKLVFFVLIRMCETMEWGIFIVAPAVIAWLVLAFLAKYRWIGAGGMALVAIGALVEYVVLTGLMRTVTEGSFLTALLVLGLGINLWIIWDAAPWVTQ